MVAEKLADFSATKLFFFLFFFFFFFFLFLFLFFIFFFRSLDSGQGIDLIELNDKTREMTEGKKGQKGASKIILSIFLTITFIN